MSTASETRTIRAGRRPETKYLDYAKGVIVDFVELEPDDPEGPLELYFEGYDKPMYMPRNWHPDFDLNVGDEVIALWYKTTREDENGREVPTHRFRMDLVQD